MSELRECPFCGKTKVDRTGDGQLQWFECVACGATSGNVRDEQYLDDSGWNTRHDDWISVEDRLPKEDEDYLVKYIGYIAQLDWHNGKWNDTDADLITHWKPITLPSTNIK